MNDKVRIVIANGHKQYLREEGFRKEVKDVQEYFDNTVIDFEEDTVNFIFLKGFYQNAKQKMTVAGVYVNCTDKSIVAIKSSLRLEIEGRSANLAVIHSIFPIELIGILNSNEGLLVHFDVSVAGLDKDEYFSVRQVKGELFNVEIVHE